MIPDAIPTVEDTPSADVEMRQRMKEYQHLKELAELKEAPEILTQLEALSTRYAA